MKTAKVWDLFVRFFHWSLVISVISQLATAEDFKTAHVKVGYFIIALLILRILWGFVGSQYARFKNFIYPPAEILDYLKSLLQGRAKHYTGHNPAGGAMVFALLFFLLLTTLTGLLAYGSEGKGPLAQQPIDLVARASADDDQHRSADNQDSHDRIDRRDPGVAKKLAHFWKNIHETLAGIIIFFIILHVCGVIVSSYVHQENLILGMITGKKNIS
jgi:cytochrome b